MSKAISPLIATILLVAFVVAAGGIIGLWSTSFTSTTSGQVGERTSNFTGECAIGIIEINKVFCTASSDGLVGYWKFDEGSGANTTRDTSGNGNTGTLTNMNLSGNGTSGWNSTDCKFGSCLSFDGTNDVVRIESNLIGANPSAFTFEAWIKYLAAPPAYTIVMADWDGSTFGRRMLQVIGGKIGLSTDGSAPTAIANNAPTVGRWYHTVAVYDSTESTEKERIYIDGTKQTTTANVLVANRAQTKFSIGDRYDGSVVPVNAVIDEVRIYNRALSADEIQRHYQHGVVVRALVTNVGQTNLGKDFILSWTVNNNFNSFTVSLPTDLTSCSTQWLSVYNITEAGNLKSVEVRSRLCPTVAREKDVSGEIC